MFKVVYKQIFIKQDTSEQQFICRNPDPLPQLHFPAVLPTYAFFNDSYKEHLEEEFDKIVEWVTSPSFKSIFVPNEEGKIDVDVEGCLDKSKFLMDLLAGQVKGQKEGDKYLENVLSQLTGLFTGKGIPNWRFD
jgi:hypothetical protein